MNTAFLADLPDDITVVAANADAGEGGLLGVLEPDSEGATNERVVLRIPAANRTRALRNQFVRIEDADSTGAKFLGRIITGPFFPAASQRTGDIRATVEVQAELTSGRPLDTNNRPAAGSAVYGLTSSEVCDLLGCAGDMLLGTISGSKELTVGLQSQSKDVLPRNVGVFGTVGSGKSNTTAVLIEEAAAKGWAVIVLDVEGEYIGMDAPCAEEKLIPELIHRGRPPAGVRDLHVRHPVSCTSDRPDSKPFTLRLADFESAIITELIHATLPERNALLDSVEYFENKSWHKMPTNEMDRLLALIESGSQAKLPYTIQQLYDRARERSSRSTELMDFLGLSTKLMWLLHSGAFDQQNMKALDAVEMLVPGRVTVLDVSVANDTVKNLVTADLLRKTFAMKLAKPASPPTMVVIEEAHSFISREKVHAMQATLQMLRNVTRRGRKRWLSTCFVSQQPGHLPPEIFELCNTRIVHTLRSMHNLEALMATTSDITAELWERCPLLGTGEAIVSSPQLKRPAIVSIRPASSKRQFVN